MANQVIVTNTGNVQVALTPPANVQVQISRAAIGTISNVPTANFANYAANVTASNQPNITSLGTLTGLNVLGNGTITNFVVTGNLQAGNLFANNANYANFAGEAFNVNVSNVSGLGNIATLNLDGNISNVLRGDGSFGSESGNLNANYANFAGEAFIVNASNILGTINLANFATVANGVALSNVSGAGNIASINLDGNASNILFGNGVFGPESGNLNANYANFAGEAFNVSGSNVTGEVANAAYANAANTANLATFATTANAVAGANVSGTVANATFALDAGNSNLANTANSVAVANVSGIGNIATVNLDGNASNILYGNGVFATTPIISNVANANYANFAGEAFNVNASNITGTVANANYSAYAGEANTANLATFATTANSVAGANVSGTVANATFALDAGNANLANLATYATTANSVAGANVSGEVANANFASYSNIAASANSVALANVVGIGNIANINLDGSSSNVLFGNGVFAPESTSIANANYSNFAGTLINGTSNVSIPSANGTIAFSVNNTANLMLLENGGVVNAFPTSSVVNMMRINTFNNPLSDAHRVAWARARGTNASPTSVQANDNLGVLSFFGHNGTSYQTNSVGFVRARVDGSYTTNGANIPIGMQVVVNDTNGGINNQTKTHNFWANGNVTFANSVFVTDSLSATGNVDSGNINVGVIGLSSVQITPGFITAVRATGNSAITADIYNGSGANLSNINGGNVTGAVAFATTANSVAGANVSGEVAFAATANSVAVANVSGIGNIATINLDGSSSNVLFGNGVFAPESTSIANANYANFAGTVITNAQPNITSVGNLVSLNVLDSANVTGAIQQLAPNTITITTNSTNNTAYNLTTLYGQTSNIVEPGQRAIIRSRGNVSTPATVAVSDVGSRDRVYFYNGTTNAVGFTTSVILSNLNSNSNAVTTGAQYNISVGNPNGDQGNANASSGFNLLQLNQNGQLVVLPGANSSVGSMLQLYSYGQPASLSTSQGITFSKARGNRDGNLSVEANDQIGRLTFQGHNGTSFVTNRLGFIRAVVDNSYVANTANIPVGLQMVTCDNTTSYTHNFYANGTTLFGGNLVSLGVTGTSTLGEVTAGNVTIGNTSGANIATLRINGDKSIFSGIQMVNGQYLINCENIDPGTGFSPLGIGLFNSANASVPVNRFFRARGNITSPNAVIATDQISFTNYGVYGDSGNTYLNVFDAPRAVVTGNDGAGNVTANLEFYTFNNGSNIVFTSTNTYASGNLIVSGNISAANVAINSNGFVKLASYTEAALTAITGQIGWMAAVSDSAGGSHPNGMIAFWDTTNTRWSYIHDNSAV